MTDAEIAALPEEIRREIQNAYMRGREDALARTMTIQNQEITTLREMISHIQRIVAD